MRDLATEKVRDDELTVSEVKSWAQRDFADAIADRIAASEQMAVDRVRELWTERVTSFKRRASYASGTILVEKPKKKERKSTTRRPQQRRRSTGRRDDRQQRIERKPPTPDEWWARASPASRRDWLLAFYAENSGDVEVLRVDYKACTRCSGTGKLEVLSGGGADTIICDRCYALGRDKTVVFR